MSHSVATSTAVFHHAAEVVVSAGQITAVPPSRTCG
jgi:hypothetical protein